MNNNKLKIGGISLPNSISFIGPTNMTRVNIETEEIISGKVQNSRFLDIIRKIPFVRGPIMLLRQLWYFDKKFGPIITFLISIGILFPVLVTFFPSLMNETTNTVMEWVNYGLLIIYVIGFVYVIYKYGGKLWKMMKQMKQNHGAEHKTLWCYNKGLKINVENIKKMPKEHPNCGGTVVVWYFILLYIFRAIPCVSIIALSISVEMLLLAEKIKLIFFPSWLFQQLTTREPTDDVIRKAIKAFDELLMREHTKEINFYKC